MENTLLRQVKSYINDNLSSAKVNAIDPTKDNFTQALSISEIKDEIEISKDDYYRALSISIDKDLELQLKRKSEKLKNFCFVSNYFEAGLKALLGNMFLIRVSQ